MELCWSSLPKNQQIEKPILSIITPIYNRINFFEKMIDSILLQKYKLNGIIELIVFNHLNLTKKKYFSLYCHDNPFLNFICM